MAAPTSRSRAFFLELVLDITIFALCAAVALQVFANAQQAADESSALTHLSIEAQAAAELFKQYGDTVELEDSLGATRSGETLTCYYDDDFLLTRSKDAPYRIVCELEGIQGAGAANTASAHITIHNQTGELFAMDVKRYEGREGEGRP